MNDLLEMPVRVAEVLGRITEIRTRPAEGEFCAVEHICHLRDIEAEGYAVRIAQLMREDDPLLRDLDGEAMARERRYIEQDPNEALRAFADARARSVALLRGADEATLAREGMFENVGRVTLAKLVEMMRAHDRGHLRDLESIALAQAAQENQVSRGDAEMRS